MGNCTSKSKSVSKDPADKSLDEVEIKECKIAQFDEVFTSVSETGNYIVTLNNNVVNAEEKVKELATLLLGAYRLKLETVTHSTHHELHFKYEDGEGVHLTKRDWMTPDLDALDCSLVQHRDSLNRALSKHSAAVLQVDKKGKVKLSGEVEGKHKQELKHLVQNLNLAVFPVKQELMKVSLKESVNLAKALKCALEEMKKQIKNMKPKVNVDADGIADGDIKISLDLGIDFNKIGGKPKQIWDALMSEEDEEMGLIPTIINTVKELPSIKEKVQAMTDAVKGLPQEPAALQSACTEANISPLQIPSTIKTIGTDIKVSAGVPPMLLTFIENLRSVANEVKEGFVA